MSYRTAFSTDMIWNERENWHFRLMQTKNTNINNVANFMMHAINCRNKNICFLLTLQSYKVFNANQSLFAMVNFPMNFWIDFSLFCLFNSQWNTKLDSLFFISFSLHFHFRTTNNRNSFEQIFYSISFHLINQNIDDAWRNDNDDLFNSWCRKHFEWNNKRDHCKKSQRKHKNKNDDIP